MLGDLGAVRVQWGKAGSIEARGEGALRGPHNVARWKRIQSGVPNCASEVPAMPGTGSDGQRWGMTGPGRHRTSQN